MSTRYAQLLNRGVITNKMKQLKLAVKWEVKINGKHRSVQLFDDDGNKLDGNKARWGGDFNCGINQLTSLEGAPKTRSTGVHARIRKAKLARGLLWADGILLRILSKKRTGNTTIYRCRKIGSKVIAYVAQRGDTFSHGTTAREAVSDLIFKTEKRDVEEYKKWSRNKVVSKAKAIEAYRSITGACSFGVKDFCAGRKIPARLSVSKVIEITEGKYGNDTFRNFKWGNK